MYVIVEINGQQFKAEEGKKLFVHHIQNAENGATVEFEKVLLVDNNGRFSAAAPQHLEGHPIQLAEQQLPSDFTLVVLAGGASSHMGREKSDLLLDGQTFLEIQIGKGCQLGAKQILISGYRGTQCGEEIVPDRISGQGPLGGLESCFRRAKTEKCLVLGVDTPLVPVEELQNLLKFAMEKADQPVTMLCHNGKEESLIAVYDARLYKEITDFLASDASDYLNGAIIPVDGGYLVK